MMPNITNGRVSALSKAFKMNKKANPFEVYVNLHAQVLDKELITEIHCPVK